MSYVNKHLQRALEERGIFSQALMDKIIKKGSLQRVREVPQDIKDIYVTSMDITAEDHILMQAAMQRHCENAISKTINFPNQATREDVFCGYMMAWRLGIKGCTVYRDGSRFLQVLNLHEDDSEDEAEVAEHSEGKSTQVVQETESIPDAGVKRKLLNEEEDHIPEVSKKQKRITLIPNCPDCNKEMTPMEGCQTCLGCGFSLCSRS